MLTEEAHHMFVGETGIGRIIKRALEVMKEIGSDDPESVRKASAIDLPLLQRYVNFWFSSCMDLFGSEKSSNAATYFATGLKGRPDEASFEDHIIKDATYDLNVPDGEGGMMVEAAPARNAVNEMVRQAYVKDCQMGVTRWNRLIKKAGFDFEILLPSTRFRRAVGPWAGHSTDPQGNPISAEKFEGMRTTWLPTEADRVFVKSLMQQVTEPGKMAGWIAPPDRGIDSKPVDYEYVKLT
jgi:benzoyl-CoA 2,3-dioxygenase component B